MPTISEYLKPYEAWLDLQAQMVRPYEDYYAGRHKMAFATMKYQQTFGALFKALSVNWCELAVDASVDRLKVEGFRFDGSNSADSEAWEDVWQPNNLDSKSLQVHTEAGKAGRAYVLVAPGPDGPKITVEHPSQMVVAHAAGDRSTRTWAFKRFLGDDGYLHATLYFNSEILRFRTREPASSTSSESEFGSPIFASGTDWEYDPIDPGGRHLLGVVPVIPFYNKPEMLTDGISDLAAAIPIQDMINKEVADMLLASEFAAFPQRVLMGVEVPTEPDGTPTTAVELKSAVSRFWAIENENAKIAEFSAAPLNNYIGPISELVRQFGAITRTPPHYLVGEVVNASGDALKTAEAGLATKVARKQIDFSDSWEEALRLAFKILGREDRAAATNAETIWKDPEKRSEAELVDAALKLKALGVPLRACWEHVGFSQQQIQRFETEPPEEAVPETVSVAERSAV